MRRIAGWTKTLLLVGILLAGTFVCRAQVDPIHRNMVHFGHDQPLGTQGPQAIYAYYYYNDPDFYNTNLALRLAIAPAYFDGEIGFKQLLSPTTDVGLGIAGGGFADDYYEVRQGHYIREESFDGHGGGASLSVYQLCNPGQLIPLNLVARGGVHYSTYTRNDDTAGSFGVPHDRVASFVRTGVRLAGKEPMLYPALGLEISAWFERQWRLNDDYYGYSGDRRVEPRTDLYWAYAGINYSWTDIGHQVSLAVTAGGSDGTDRFSAWRLGGVLPLMSEFPLVLPGYYYEEITARRFVHLYGSYEIALDPAHRFKFRVESAAASLDYLPGFEQRNTWQTGVGGGLSFTPQSQVWRVILRYGYGINALRNDQQGGHSIGLLFQYDFERQKESKRSRP